jgi:hypothetical protein
VAIGDVLDPVCKPVQKLTIVVRHARIGMVAGVTELKVGDRPGGASYWLPVHTADHADENLGSWKDLQNARSFRGDIRPVNRDETDIICSGFQTQAAEFLGGERAGARLPCLAPEGGDGRMSIE